ncbi:hypothetical protein BD408DRAFT_443411 [Parasitella parasitica]|nr:hypothetical protein BD408DRAFT_443411 [Parasitella parasitica]
MQIICSICLSPIGKHEAVALAVCGHVFDLTCILHCMQINKRCPQCKQDIFGSTQQEQFIKMYLSTDDSDEKDARLLKSQINAAAAEIRSLKSQRSDYTALAVRYSETEKELKRSRELISLLHEEFNNLKIDASMARMDIRRQA